MNFLSAIVGTSLKAMGQERNQSKDSLATTISSKKYIDMADDMATQAKERQKYGAAVKPQVDNSFVRIINQKYQDTLATLSEVQSAAKSQALRQGLHPSIIKKIDYDFTFSDTSEGTRTDLKKL